jgi:DNA-binding transcriptional LysR family regulator
MKRTDLYDLAAFAVVAEKGSFTRAAAELGMSQSALSHAMKTLEERLGVRLLSRTTRSVSTTEAGETLLRSLRPALDEIAASVDTVGSLRGKASGTVRITATKHAASSVVMPALPAFLATHPAVQVDLIIDDNLTDVRVGPDIKMAVVGAPSYFVNHPPPRTPGDLSGHRCINYRRIKSGGLYAWDFEDKGRQLQVRVDGPLVFNNSDLIREAALLGQGLAYVYEDEVEPDVKAGRLSRVLTKWCPTFAGYHLYYPSRRQATPAFSLLVDALRYRQKR